LVGCGQEGAFLVLVKNSDIKSINEHKIDSCRKFAYFDRWIASILSKKGTYMFMLVLRQPDVMVFVRCAGNSLAPGLPPGMESQANLTDTSLAAFNLG
jgi:hypothetical protein